MRESERERKRERERERERERVCVSDGWLTNCRHLINDIKLKTFNLMGSAKFDISKFTKKLDNSN